MSPLPHYQKVLFSILLLLLPLIITGQNQIPVEENQINTNYEPKIFYQPIDHGNNTPLIDEALPSTVMKQLYSNDSDIKLSTESIDSNSASNKPEADINYSSSLLKVGIKKDINNFQVFSITVCGEAPVGTPDYYQTATDRQLIIDAPGFLQNDIDLQGEAIVATAILDPPDNGILSAFADGNFVYIPNPGFIGDDGFAYRMRDASNNYSDSVFVTITVSEPSNRTPIGQDDIFGVTANTTLVIDAPGFLQNDIDQDGEMITATAILDPPDNGQLSAFADGKFTYIPDQGFTGVDTFAYRMRDASNNYSDSVKVTINVLEGNRPPEGIDDKFVVVKNGTLSIPTSGFLINDFDPDEDEITATAILDPPDHGILSAFAAGQFTYIPDPDYTGPDKFVYRMRDALFNISDSVTVEITVIENGTMPVGVNDHFKISNDRDLIVDAPGFLINDIDTNGEVITATAILDPPDHGILSAFADGQFIYIPDPEYTGPDKFAYRMRDASSNFSDSVFVTIDVAPSANRDPVGYDDYYTALTNMSLVVNSPGFLINDIDQDSEAITATAILDPPDNGTLSAFADGHFNYTPDSDFEGMDSFAYRMKDASNNNSDSVRVYIMVVKGNRNPIGLDDHYTAIKNTTLTIPTSGFLANDYDADGDAITATAILSSPENGNISAFADGKFVYIPNEGFVGSDKFVYRMKDATNNLSDSVEVFIEVIEENKPPIAVFENQTFECEGPEGTEVILDGSGSSDPEEGILLYSWYSEGELIAGPSTAPTTTVILQVGSFDYLLKVVDECGKEDNKTATITVDDSLPPEVSAALTPSGNNEYIVSCLANDVCSDNLTTTSVIKIPDLINPAIQYKINSSYSIEIDQSKNTVEIKAPNPQLFWINISNNMGVEVNDGQILELKYEKNKFKYKFDDFGNLVSVKGDVITLLCKAIDEENNISTSEAILPMTSESSLSLHSLQVNNSSGSLTINEPTNYPNPFSDITTIRYFVENNAKVTISIFDQTGRKLEVLVDKNQTPGIYEIDWNGQEYQNGIYLYQIQQNNYLYHGKLMIQHD
ncbi:Ig-like domain-containing protein [Mangrovivirga sp. M17]|uniref:Ig-like domain-containing protein n=1 Tax=Mangrovivirga halotolerans TaxID=2993936 RepID=A0ABT3RM51_9BACT|nr:Ig-like domain-containing protein [Mangrovivirga halotolerans]MCX2742593.1 Ig-like domain-containing protein [Mangrovivirga halotolerans]